MGIEQLLQRFIQAWNTDDPDERRRLVEDTCAGTIEVVSPYGDHSGIDAQLASIAQVRSQFPQLRCSAKILSQYRGWVMDAWTTEFGADRPPLHGIDVSQLDETGRIRKVISFSPVPPD
jgi:SnoaL-like domain